MKNLVGEFANRWLAKAPRPVAVALALVAAWVLPSPASAEALRMANVRVFGGEASWHARDVFGVDWDQVPGPPVDPRAVLYRLYDSEGNRVVGPVRETRNRWSLEVLIPTGPGAYTLEAWLEDTGGQAGPPAYATLRFDNEPPAPPAPTVQPGWLSSRERVQLQIGHPPGPPPVSGIRGYAISLDQGGGGSPCASPTACTLAETDLPGGAGDDTTSLGPLPEGTTFARVLAVSGAGVASPLASVPIRVDGTAPQVLLQGLPGGWSGGPVRLAALASDPLSGMTAAGPNGPFTAIAVDGGAPTLAAGDSVTAWATGSGVHRISYFARDAAGNAGDGVLGPPPATARVAIDEEPPRVAFAAAQDPAEPERIEATVSDALSGPSPAAGSIGLRPAGSHGRFEELPTRVLGDRLVAHWDSDAYPPGKYEFLATGYDRAGNAGTGDERVRGAKMVLVNPLKAPATLEAGFGGRELVWQSCRRGRHGRRCHRRRTTRFDTRPDTRTVPFGHGVRFGGRLAGISGRALGGLEVAIQETFAPGSEPRQRTTLVRTAADGSFSLRLAPGPSREVTAAFAGSPTLTRAAAGSVHLGVLAAVRLRASAPRATVGGAPVVFSGSVDATGVGAKQGLPVELQFRYPGAGWSEFRTVETDAAGRFRYAYRFSDDDSRGVRFQFRAATGQKEGWPYEPAFSRPVAVSGR